MSCCVRVCLGLVTSAWERGSLKEVFECLYNVLYNVGFGWLCVQKCCERGLGEIGRERERERERTRERENKRERENERERKRERERERESDERNEREREKERERTRERER